MAPFPASRFPLARFADENARAEGDALAALERILDAHAGRVAAVLIEPIQSEGGDRHASPAFFERVQALAEQAGAAFMLDEVQTGVGITGTLWAHEQLELPRPPDLVAFGKKMQMGGFFATAPYCRSRSSVACTRRGTATARGRCSRPPSSTRSPTTGSARTSARPAPTSSPSLEDLGDAPPGAGDRAARSRLPARVRPADARGPRRLPQARAAPGRLRVLHGDALGPAPAAPRDDPVAQVDEAVGVFDEVLAELAA